MQDLGASLVEVLFSPVAEVLVSTVRHQLLDGTRPGHSLGKLLCLVLVILAYAVYLVIAETEDVRVANMRPDVILHAPDGTLLGIPLLGSYQLIHRLEQFVPAPQPAPVPRIFPVWNPVEVVIKLAIDPGIPPRLPCIWQNILRTEAGGDGFLIITTGTYT